jgi:opacity protein-like surface antigen
MKMLNAAVLVFMALVLPVSVIAQDSPKTELFGGYSYSRIEGAGLNGWNASIAQDLTRHFGIVADFGGNYKSESETVSGVNASARARLYSFMFGPRFYSRFSERWTPFAHALFGATHASIKATGSTGGTSVSLSDSDTAFSMAYGGGIDYQVSRSLAVRLVQADYMILRSGGENTNGARISTGIVFRLGKKQ